MWRFLLSGLLNISGLVLLFVGSLDDPVAKLRELYSALVITQAPVTQAAAASSLNDAEQIVPPNRATRMRTKTSKTLPATRRSCRYSSSRSHPDHHPSQLFRYRPTPSDQRPSHRPAHRRSRRRHQ